MQLQRFHACSSFFAPDSIAVYKPPNGKIFERVNRNLRRDVFDSMRNTEMQKNLLSSQCFKNRGKLRRGQIGTSLLEAVIIKWDICVVCMVFVRLRNDTTIRDRRNYTFPIGPISHLKRFNSTTSFEVNPDESVELVAGHDRR